MMFILENQWQVKSLTGERVMGLQNRSKDFIRHEHGWLSHAGSRLNFRLLITYQAIPIRTNKAIKIAQPCGVMLPPNAPAALVITQAMPRPSILAIKKRFLEIFPRPAT